MIAGNGEVPPNLGHISMLTIKHKPLSVPLIIKVFSLPTIIYIVFFSIRIQGIQPPAETGMGDFITAIFFIFGASVTYLIYVIKCVWFFPPSGQWESWYWMLVSYFLVFLSYDEIFMIHETLSATLNVSEASIFIIYGLILIALLVSNRPKISRTFFFFLLCFIFFGSVAVISDTFYGEGVITIFGKRIDYEQLAESMGALSLSCAFTSAVVRELPLFFHFSDKGGKS